MARWRDAASLTAALLCTSHETLVPPCGCPSRAVLAAMPNRRFCALEHDQQSSGDHCCSTTVALPGPVVAASAIVAELTTPETMLVPPPAGMRSGSPPGGLPWRPRNPPPPPAPPLPPAPEPPPPTCGTCLRADAVLLLAGHYQACCIWREGTQAERGLNVKEA